MQPQLWSTASLRDGSDALALEVKALGAHILRCNGARGPWHAVRCLGDLAHSFLAPRFVTTLGLATIGLAVISHFH